MKLGAYGFLAKPFKDQVLLDEVAAAVRFAQQEKENLLRQHRGYSDTTATLTQKRVRWLIYWRVASQVKSSRNNSTLVKKQYIFTVKKLWKKQGLVVLPS
ncbi:hypothetical protein OURE66S_00515 [Oligella ureolytica]